MDRDLLSGALLRRAVMEGDFFGWRWLWEGELDVVGQGVEF